MFSRIHSATTFGITCHKIIIEVDISKGWPSFNIVGLGDTAVQEAKERIRTAWHNTKLEFPHTYKTIINLAPAHIKKAGTLFDLPMAVGMYMCTNKKIFNIDDSLFVGELALNGHLRHINGALCIAQFAAEQGFKNIYLPASNAQEAAIIKNIRVFPLHTLKELLDHLTNKKTLTPANNPTQPTSKDRMIHTNMSDIRGQRFAKRALEIAATGAHNILLNGPPGSGKTLLARTLPGILPDMTLNESIQVTQIYSVSGKLPKHTPLITERPFRSPHHSTSAAALVGGGSQPRPGEISLAHRGVLFLDELPEFPSSILEHLRQPLEDRTIQISRSQGTASFPAHTMLVASKNPCPCGYLSDKEKDCSCSAHQIERYKKKISGPLLDRIDLHVEVPRVPVEHLAKESKSESSEEIRKRVSEARLVQIKRYEDDGIFSNSEMQQKHIRRHCVLSKNASSLLHQATEQLHLSARGYFKVLKVARTIADLEKKEDVSTTHIAEAIQYRNKIDCTG